MLSTLRILTVASVLALAVLNGRISSLPGKPDIVLPRYRTVVFVHGCFWHGHDACSKGTHRPASNVEFWNCKIDKNRSRDRAACLRLGGDGWHVVTVWECHLRRRDTLERLATSLLKING